MAFNLNPRSWSSHDVRDVATGHEYLLNHPEHGPLFDGYDPHRPLINPERLVYQHPQNVTGFLTRTWLVWQAMKTLWFTGGWGIYINDQGLKLPWCISSSKFFPTPMAHACFLEWGTLERDYAPGPLLRTAVESVKPGGIIVGMIADSSVGEHGLPNKFTRESFLELVRTVTKESPATLIEFTDFGSHYGLFFELRRS